MIVSKQAVWTVPLLALAAVPALAPRKAERLRFAVEAGTTVTRTWTLSGEYQTALVEIGVSGMEVEIPDIDLAASWERTLEVTDEVEELREGAPARLARTFDTIEHALRWRIDIRGTQLSHEEEGEPDCDSELEGVGVRFTWDPEAEVYEKTLLDEDADVDLLAGLDEDMDLRGLLPEGEVEPGDRWEIEPAAFLRALRPGGDLGVRLGRGDVGRGPEMSAAGLDPRMAGSFDVMLGEPTDRGEANATFEEVREEDGRRVAVVKLEAELETRRGALELFQGWLDEYMPEDEEVEVEIERADVLFQCTLEGELLWDIGAGRAHSLQLEGDSMMTLDRACTVLSGGEEIAIEMELELEGELEVTARFE